MSLTRPVIGALSGALLVIALPKPDVAFIGWIALVPLLLVLTRSETGWQALGAGYAAGVAFFGGSCYWIVSTMHTYGGLSLPLSASVFGLFVAVFALHTAVFAWLLYRCCLWSPHALWLAAPLWVAVEIVQTHLLFGGFPWMLVGYALARFGGLLEITAWTGIYGLSFILVGVNTLIAVALQRRAWLPGALAAVLIASAALVPAPSDEAFRSGDSLEVRIVQTDIPIDFPWGGAEEGELLDELGDLSVAGGQHPGLVVWPESPGLFYLSLDPGFRARIADLSRRLDAYFLIGYIDVAGENMPTNSAGLVSPSGRQVSRYDKIHLVPFGEYVPLGRALFFAESLVRNVGDFAPGTEYTISRLDGHRIATNICYEDVFPGLIRQFTRRGAELLINITNDGWFGSSSAPWQHLRMARVRAVESHRYVIRAANTGISAIIDPYGRILSSTALGERTTLDGVVRYRSDLTFYVRFGDVFAYAVSLVAVAFLIVALARGNARRGGLVQ